MPAPAVRLGINQVMAVTPAPALEGRMSAEGELLWIGALLQRQS